MTEICHDVILKFCKLLYIIVNDTIDYTSDLFSSFSVLPNFMCVNTKFNSRDRSITLSVSLKDESPLCNVFFWTKNGQKIKIHRSDAKYLRGSIHYPSLTIFNVTHDDTGCYELNAKHSLGTTTSDKIMLGIDVIYKMNALTFYN